MKYRQSARNNINVGHVLLVLLFCSLEGKITFSDTISDMLVQNKNSLWSKYLKHCRSGGKTPRAAGVLLVA